MQVVPDQRLRENSRYTAFHRKPEKEIDVLHIRVERIGSAHVEVIGSPQDDCARQDCGPQRELVVIGHFRVYADSTSIGPSPVESGQPERCLRLAVHEFQLAGELVGQPFIIVIEERH